MTRLAAAISLLAACTASPLPTADAPTSLGWPDEVVKHPDRFEALMAASSRDGWIALHGHRYEEALSQFGGEDPVRLIAASRARAPLHALHGDLARAQKEAARRYFEELKTRGPLSSLAGMVASLAFSCSAPAELYIDEAGPAFEPVRQGWSTDQPLDAKEALVPFAKRHTAHLAARAGDASALTEVAKTALLVEPADGFDRAWWDPCLHQSLADGWAVGLTDIQLESGVTAGPTVLAATLFSQHATAADLHGAGHATASLATWKLQDGITTNTAKPEAARIYVRNLDARLDALKLALAAEATADGMAMLEQIGVVDRFRQEHLIAMARAQMRDEPAAALATLTLARDVVNKDVGPTNAPALMALLAEANLRTGHTREALDALQLLSRVHPEVHGLQELVGDLSVLQGLDRQGDSKEH